LRQILIVKVALGADIRDPFAPLAGR